jgi:hypothetical protein
MSKELERVLKAYNQVEEFISEMPVSYIGYNTLGQSEYIWDRLNEIEEALNEYVELKKALTPPTADEVCKALSEWFHSDSVKYSNITFMFEMYDQIICKISQFGIVYFMDGLPPHLITLIGRFYEGEIK